MGLFKALKTGFKSIKKAFKKVTSSKLFKAVLVAAAVYFTAGTILSAGGPAAAGGTAAGTAGSVAGEAAIGSSLSAASGGAVGGAAAGGGVSAAQGLSAATQAAGAGAAGTGAAAGVAGAGANAAGGGLIGWIEANPKTTQIVAQGVGNMFQPDEIDVMRERARLASRNYDGSGLGMISQPGVISDFNDRSGGVGVTGGYQTPGDQSAPSQPFYGSTMDQMSPSVRANSDPNQDPNSYYQGMKSRRGIISGGSRY